jgi:hypothetical protein
MTACGYFRIFLRGEKFWRAIFNKMDPKTHMVYVLFLIIIEIVGCTKREKTGTTRALYKTDNLTRV